MSTDKLVLINEYISRCETVIANKDIRGSEILQDEIIGVFEAEIPHIKSQLDNYSGMGFFDSGHKVDFISDIKLLKQKLINYAANIKLEQDRMSYELELAKLKQPNLSATAEAIAEQSITNNIEISITNIIDQINKIEDEKISPEDKRILQEYIYSLEGIKSTKNKSKFWDKSKEVLKFLIDKGIDIAKIILPYILSGLNESTT